MQHDACVYIKAIAFQSREPLLWSETYQKSQARAFLATRNERFYLKMCTFEASGSQERKRVAQLQNVWACRQYFGTECETTCKHVRGGNIVMVTNQHGNMVTGNVVTAF